MYAMSHSLVRHSAISGQRSHCRVFWRPPWSARKQLLQLCPVQGFVLYERVCHPVQLVLALSLQHSHVRCVIIWSRSSSQHILPKGGASKAIP